MIIFRFIICSYSKINNLLQYSIDACPESLRIESVDSWLPIHEACTYGKRDDTADTIQYMLELDPELINIEDSGDICLFITPLSLG